MVSVNADMNHTKKNLFSANHIMPSSLPGSLIVNTLGIPGTLGCIAWSDDFNTPVFLTSYHVLFGKNAAAGENVWQITYDGIEKKLNLIGKSLTGKIGIFQNGDNSAFIDCAIGKFSDDVYAQINFINNNSINIQGTAEGEKGECVTKIGGITKHTSGIIASTCYNDVCNVNGTIYQACNQILIKPINGQKFSAKGDSGSAILNSKNEIVGLLWCVNYKNEGIACPIAPVIEQLNINFNLTVI